MDCHQVFDAVFDEYGVVKACGREQCKLLIALLSDSEDDRTYGDVRTGCMNVDAVIGYAKTHGWLK